MKPLNRLADLIRTGDTIVLTLTRVEGGVQLLIQPTLHGADPNEADDRRRALQMGLTLPYVFSVTDDEGLTESLDMVLDQIAGARTSTLLAYESYQQQLAKAQSTSPPKTPEKKRANTGSGTKDTVATNAQPVETAITDPQPSTEPGEATPVPDLFK